MKEKKKIRRIIAILISNKFDSDNNQKKADVVLGLINSHPVSRSREVTPWPTLPGSDCGFKPHIFRMA